MSIRRRICAALVASLALASRAAADPIVVTSGYIQTYGNGTSFLFQTKNGPGFGGDTEINGIPPVFFSGHTGDAVNLSSSVDVALTGFSVFDPQRRDLAARAVFTFVAGDAVLPSASAVTTAVNGLGLLAAPFSFTGTLFVYPNFAALAAGGRAARQYELRGVGTADAMLTLSTAGATSGRDPIVSFSAVYNFEDDPAPTPEPATLLLFGSGAAALAARRRSQTRR